MRAREALGLPPLGGQPPTGAGSRLVEEMRKVFPVEAEQQAALALLAELAGQEAARLEWMAEVRRQGDAAVAALQELLGPAPDIALAALLVDLEGPTDA
jgi:hypothetical protein